MEGFSFGRVLVLTLLPFSQAVFNGGFCLDNVPEKYKGTGFTAASTLTKAQCTNQGHSWCPLSNITNVDNGKGKWEGYDWYYFSGCCTGKQGKKLIADAGENGWPTCIAGKNAKECTRTMWGDKWFKDFVYLDTSGYDFRVTVSSVVTDPNTYGGTGASTCTCKATDPNCKIKKGDACLVCKQDAACSIDQVQLGINFFKLHTIDLKTSLMSFAAWVREEWFDPRLSYDYQCYGGVEYFEAVGAAGNLENSIIWVPDIELYNNDEPIWDGSIGARNAQVYACWMTTPARGGCGYIFWSRPGILKALCKYEGIVEFPFDKATCELEFAPFGIDGRWQDLIPRKADGGANWLGNPNSKAHVGITAGSKYQDYTLTQVTVERNVVFYDCCPTNPWPDLIYKVEFSRSNDYYVVALIVPAVMLTMISWIEFWMDPAIGERLSYGITLILAMIMNMVTASALMPVCEEKVFMDYVNIVSLACGALALLETGLVLHLYYIEADTWAEALIPRKLRIMIMQYMYTNAKTRGAHVTMSASRKNEAKKTAKQGSNKAVVAGDYDDDDSLIRKQIYRQIFYVLDETHNLLLDLEEIEEFGEIMTGGNFDKAAALAFIKEHDSNWDGVLDLEEFVAFCDGHLVRTTDLLRFKQITRGFLEIIDRKRDARVHMWQKRAAAIDVFSRWTIPAGYGIFFIMLCTMSLESLEDKMLDVGKQMPLYVVAFIPVTVSLFLYSVWGCIDVCCFRTKKVGPMGAPQDEMFGPGSASVGAEESASYVCKVG